MKFDDEHPSTELFDRDIDVVKYLFTEEAWKTVCDKGNWDFTYTVSMLTKSLKYINFL